MAKVSTSSLTVYVHYKHNRTRDAEFDEPDTMELEEAMQKIVEHANSSNLRIVSTIVLPIAKGEILSREKSTVDSLGHKIGESIGLAYAQHPDGVSITVLFQSAD